MNFFAMALIYLGFFALIFGATYITGSAWCLWALLLAPSYSSGKKNDDS